MSAHFELLTAVLVLVNRSEDSYDLSVSRKRNRTANLASVSLSCLYNLLCCGINDCCVLALESHSDLVLCHLFVLLVSIAQYRIMEGDRVSHRAERINYTPIKSVREDPTAEDHTNRLKHGLP